MIILFKINLLLFFVVSFCFEGLGQSFSDTLQVVAGTIKIPEIERGYSVFGFPRKSVMVICGGTNLVKGACPEKFSIDGIDVYFLRRADLNGRNIDYWMALDSIEFSRSEARAKFSMIKTKDGWIDKFDEIDFRCEAFFSKVDLHWVLQKWRLY